MNGITRIGFLQMLESHNVRARTANLIQGKDTDGDGALNAGELGVSEDMFAGIDKNEDGQAGGEELCVFLSKARLNHKASNVIENRDTNGDAVLNAEELGISEERFARIDQDEDGQMSRSELKAYLPKAYLNSKTATWIENNDINGDGILDSSEFRVSPERFAEIDKNENGRMERIEFGAALAKIHYTA